MHTYMIYKHAQTIFFFCDINRKTRHTCSWQYIVYVNTFRYIHVHECEYIHFKYVTCSHIMIDKSHFGTIEIFTYSARRENADYRGEKMIVVSAKIKKLWRVKVNGGESIMVELDSWLSNLFVITKTLSPKTDDSFLISNCFTISAMPALHSRMRSAASSTSTTCSPTT